MNPARYNNLARLSTLGALGSGTTAGVTNSNDAETNGAPIGPGTSEVFTSTPHVCKTGKVLVTVDMTMSANGGTLVAGDAITFSIIRDNGGTPVTVGGAERAGAVAIGADVGASGSLTFIDSVTPGSSHTYSAKAAIAGGHTGGFLTGEVQVTIVDV